MDWFKSTGMLEAIARRVEAIALRLEAIALRLEAISSRLEAIASTFLFSSLSYDVSHPLAQLQR